MFLDKIRWFKIPFFFKFIYGKGIFNLSREEKVIYLTFDDGPILDLTEFILDQLSAYNAKATFFCVGENIKKNSTIFQKILQNNHAVGNHTFNHLKGTNTSNDKYFENIRFCEQIMASHSFENKTKLFRPPYGKMKLSQYNEIKKTHKIIFWDMLTYDFDNTLSPEKCYENAIKHIKNGSIVVFHDNIKATASLKFLLPKLLKYYKELGFEFKSLSF